MFSVREMWRDTKLLLRSVPSLVISVFFLSVVCMNLMAGRELYRSAYFCINSGLALSWISFLCMDCICKRFGPQASLKISILAMLVNILCCLIFKVLTMTPGRWAAFYAAGDPAVGEMIHAGVDSTFGSAWYVVLGSAAAMLLSSIVNAVLNQAVGSRTDHGDFQGFAVRSLVSTCAAQWVDNFVFSALVSHVFFGWNWTQVLICSTTSMIIELVAEAVFTPLGYRISRAWEQEDVGREYVHLHSTAAEWQGHTA